MADGGFKAANGGEVNVPSKEVLAAALSKPPEAASDDRTTLAKLFDLPPWDASQPADERAAFVAEAMKQARLQTQDRRLIYTPDQPPTLNEVMEATQMGYFLAEDRLNRIAKHLSQGARSGQEQVQAAMGDIPDVRHLISTNDAWDVAEAAEAARQQPGIALELSEPPLSYSDGRTIERTQEMPAFNGAIERTQEMPAFNGAGFTQEITEEIALQSEKVKEGIWGRFNRFRKGATETALTFVKDVSGVTERDNRIKTQREAALIAGKAREVIEKLPKLERLNPDWQDDPITADRLESTLKQLGYVYGDDSEEAKEALKTTETLRDVEELTSEGEVLSTELRHMLENKYFVSNQVLDDIYEGDTLLNLMRNEIDTFSMNSTDAVNFEDDSLTLAMERVMKKGLSLKALAETIAITRTLGWSTDGLQREFSAQAGEGFDDLDSFDMKVWIHEAVNEELHRSLDSSEVKFLGHLVDAVLSKKAV